MPGAELDDLDNAHLLVEGVIDRAEAKEAAERKRKVRYLFYKSLYVFQRHILLLIDEIFVVCRWRLMKNSSIKN